MGSRKRKSVTVKVFKHTHENSSGKKVSRWVIYWSDPDTGRRKQETLDPEKFQTREAATKEAGRREEELSNTRRVRDDMTWEEFRDRYEDEHLSGLRPKSQACVNTAFNAVERILKPELLSDVDAGEISRLKASLDKGRVPSSEGRKPRPIRPASIAMILRSLKAALRWAESMRFIREAPEIEMPKLTKGDGHMKGRPITGEEFDRMIEAVGKVCGDDREPWQRLITGLWLSGLRLGEALSLSWDAGAGIIPYPEGEAPVICFRGDSQKNGRNETVPMAPEFADFLLETPNEARSGLVFKLPRPMSLQRVSKVICRIGKKAGIKVSDGSGPAKYASAHDLRRSFGARWAKRVKSAVLQRMMRHADIATTSRYYVDMDAKEIAREIRQSQIGDSVGKVVGKAGPAGKEEPCGAS
jgi:integrase